MHKKLLSLVLALCLAVSLVPAIFAAESGKCGADAYWSFDKATGTMTISGTGATDDYIQDLSDPEPSPWDDLRGQIRHLVAEEGITKLGNGCFMNCTALESVEFPSTLIRIGDYCFDSAEKLAEVTLPDGLKVIGQWAFRGCSSLTRVEVPGTVTHLTTRAFENCTGLTEAVIHFDPNVSGRISSNAIFRGCTALKQILVDDNHTILMDFDGVLYLNNKLGKHLLQYPLGREDTEFTVADGTVSVERYSVENAVHLRSITIPASVTKVGQEALTGPALEEIRFFGNAPDFYDGALGNLPMTVYYPYDNETWTEDIRNSQGPHITWNPFNPANPFRDVPLGSFCEEPVLWALEKDITTGASETAFDPMGTCLRAHVVTFLWRAADCPEPTAAVNPFVDVKESDFFYKAVLWAVENNITDGVDATHFDPTGVCNRAQVVTFLYRAFRSPAVEGASNPFHDVPAGAFYEAPVLWAVANGITDGLSATEFGPDAACNRAQVVTFLYRAYN